MTSAILERASAIKAGEPYSNEQLESLVEEFHREGYLHLGPILDEEEVAALKDAMDRKYNDTELRADKEGDHYRGISLNRMFEYDTVYRDITVREPLIGLAEALLGADCHLMSQNALRNGRGEAINGWHVDDQVLFPLPDDVSRHDARVRPPCFIINFMFPLTDVDALEFGPTQVVPRSHYSGRNPVSQENPTFEDNMPVDLLSKAGDVYLFNNQVWHRGAMNDSDRVRYVATSVYSKRCIAQRFYPFLNYRMPDRVLEGADDRLLRVLGKHAKGPYG